jgi:tetratricopeptide (TPR) repeat protein
MVTEKIKSLLQEGLDLYGYGKIEEAIEKWKEVLELDPGNLLAMDYLHSAGIDVDKLFEKEEKKEDIENLLKKGRTLEAYEMIIREERNSLYKMCLFELVRYRLDKEFRERYLKGKVVPQKVVSERELIRKALTPADAFIVSQIDGKLTVEDLIDITDMNEFELCMSLSRLEREGIIKV